MRYGLRLSSTMLVFTIRWNMMPLFYENGELHTRLKITEAHDNVFVMKWARSDEPAHGYLRPTRSDVKVKGMRLDLRITGYTVKVDRNISMRPIDGGIKLYLGAEPDPGQEPRISPVYMKRVNFKNPKTIKDDRGTLKIFLMNKTIKNIIDRRFTALSHVGGSMFLFVRSPLEIRAPFLEITHVDTENYTMTYAKLPNAIAAQIGLLGKTYGCYDFIEDIDGRYYLRLVESEECDR